jgi:hypothetical protein
MTMGMLEKRIPLSIRAYAGRLACSLAWRWPLDLGLLRPLAELVVPAASAAAAAAAAAVAAVAEEEDLEMERWWMEEDGSLWALAEERPVVEGLRKGGLVPGTTGFFRGGAIVHNYLL